VVLCDLGLPGLSGYEVARALRADEPTAARLIALSGYAEEWQRQSLAAGFDRALLKPVAPEALRRLLAEV
jgi:CheY-like chemotaxis protein